MGILQVKCRTGPQPSLLSYLFPVKAQKVGAHPFLWLDSGIPILPGTPTLLLSSSQDLALCTLPFLLQPDTSPSSRHTVFHLQQHPTLIDKSLSPSTTVSGKRSGKQMWDCTSSRFQNLHTSISTVMVKYTHSPIYLQWLLPTTLDIYSEQQRSEWTRAMDSNHLGSLSSHLIWTLPSFINSDLQTILGNKKIGDESHFLKVGTIISIYVPQYCCP